jgi:uncharacterized membrane protein
MRGLTVVAVVLGAWVGGVLGEGFGALAGAVLAWLGLRVHRQGQDIAALQEALKGVSTVRPVLADAAPLTAEEPAAEPAPVEDIAVPTVPLPLPPTPAEIPVEPAAAGDTLLSRARAWLLGGNTIAKLGVGILFVGLAFLARYASEHVHVPVELRLAGIGAVALVLLGLGWRLRLARPGYAQALQGGAVAVLYLTLFVAFRFYGVLGVGPVFAAMVAVAMLAAALAVLQDARGLAVIGALGGFATPLLVSTGSGNHVALFSYYLVLDLGIAAVAWFKTWRLLNVVGFVFTFVVATVWGGLSYRSEHYASGQAFLIAYFLLFNAVLMMPARRLGDATTPRSDQWINGSLLFGLPTISFVLQHGLVRDTTYGTAISALLMAAFYVAMAARMKRHPALAVTFEATLAIATVFLTLVIPFALDARSTAGAWALEGAGLVWLGLRQGRWLPRAFGYALFVLGSGSLLLSTLWQPAPGGVFNAWFMNALLVAAGAVGGAFFVQRRRLAGGLMRFEASAEPLLIALGALWALAAVGWQVDQFVPERQAVSAWLVGLSLIAGVCTALCVRLRWPGIAWPTLALVPLLFIALGHSSWQLPSPAAAGGWWAWPLALAAQAAVLWRAAPAWPRPLRRAVHALGVLLLAALGALQGASITRAWGDEHSAWAWLGWFVVPALLLAVLPRAATARRWPVSAEPAAYQQAGAGVLAAGLLLWTLLANTFSNGAAAPLPHVPLLNPLDLGLAAALLACALWARSDAARGVFAQAAALPPALLGVASFVWLNAMLVRGFHHYGGVPYRFDDWTASLAVQTGITLLWSATALVLMWLSARRGQRVLWIVGAALLAAVVAKLLLVDLSGSGTVTRIVSFIGVGLLMLVIAYVAPLPSTEPARENR